MIYILISNSCLSQRTYEFGSDNSPCSFKYMFYAPNNNYMNFNRPIIMIIGNKGQDAQAVFQNDTLKNISSFYMYLFIYIPNSGHFHDDKFSCVQPLMSMITSNYNYGHKNLFLEIKDTTITSAEVDSSTLRVAFNKINLEHSSPAQQRQEITVEFKQDLTVVQPTIPIDDEDTVVTNQDSTNEVVRKAYFGPPQAYNFTLSGTVRDEKTGETLPYATVKLISVANGTATNADGYFTLFNVPTDTSTLAVQYIGYKKAKVFLTPLTAKNNLNILMDANSRNLSTVTITANHSEIMNTDNPTPGLIEMSAKEISKMPNLGEPDVMRSLQLMPGVSAANESSSGLYVLGGTPDQNLVLFDGFTVYYVNHLYGFFSAFNSDALKDIQLYKGGYESKYGGRLSSVTDITGKDGDQNHVNIGVSLSLLSYKAFIEAPIGKKFSSVITFRKSYQGIIYNEIFDKFNGSSSNSASASSSTSSFPSRPGGFGQTQTTPTSYFYDLNGKFTYHPTTKDIISLSIYNGEDYLNNGSSISSSGLNFGANNTDLTNYGNTGTSLKWARRWSDKFYGTTLISYSNYFNDRTQSSNRTITVNGDATTSDLGVDENNNLKDYSFKSDYQWDLFKGNQLQFGVFASYYDIKYTYSQNDTATIINNHNTGTLSGAYVQDQVKLFKDKLQILPGIRTSYFNITGKPYYEPRVSATLNLTDEIIIKAATGKYYQFVNQVTQENVLSGNTNFWVLADGKQLPVSSADHYIASIAYDKTDYIFSIEGYYKRLYNLTQYSLRFDPSPTATSYSEDFYTGTGYSKGLEFLAQKKSGKLTGWISYTLSTTMNYFSAFSNTYYPASQDAPNEVHIVVMYKWKKWDFSATWIYATGLPYTAPSGVYGITLLDGTTQYYYTVSTENSLRLPDYSRMDISANYNLYANAGKRRREIGSISFSIFNVYNRQNVWYRTYTVVTGSIIQTNVNYLGFTPNVTLALKIR